MKKCLLIVLAFVLFCPEALAAKTTYIATNHRFNYIKLKEVNGSVVQSRGMTHPVNVDELALRKGLESIKLARSFVIKKEVDSQRIFSDSAVDFLAPNLASAFAQAAANEEVAFSYLQKNPIFIIRNDRLNLGQAWMHNNELHVRFDKLYAKVTGDTDKRGGEAKAIAQAQGLRIQLDLEPGQKLGLDDPTEVVVDLDYIVAQKTEGQGDATQQAAANKTEAEKAAKDKSKKGKLAKKGREAEAGNEAGGGTPSAVTPVEPRDPKERLEQLDKLKKDGLISRKEYDEKRKEILKGL